MKIAIIREEKTPSDSRVVLTPSQCATLRSEQNLEIVVQSSQVRSYTDSEYKELNVPVVDDVTDCDILIGVKEVPIDALIPDKTYFFFSHTIKEQAYNRKLLQSVLSKNIRLIDYEVITNEANKRLIAFGVFAGMVGAHNGIWTYGQRTGQFTLPRLHTLKGYKEAVDIYKQTPLPPMRIALTGTGRVSTGAAKVLDDMGIQKVSPFDYVKGVGDGPVYTQLSSFFYARRKDGKVFDSIQDFYDHPSDYSSDFHHFLPCTDIMINGIYWDNDAPAFFTKEQMQSDDFRISVIADVTCDIAPISSIPSTLKASTIPDPIFGYDPKTDSEVAPHGDHTIDMMTIDNLPNELPRDASKAFGEMFIEHVLPELSKESSLLLDKATIAKGGELTEYFAYLSSFAEASEDKS